jgi:predicted site-specific integrase-resolvase
LNRTFEGTISEIVVVHQERLFRFGFAFVIKVFQHLGVKIVVQCQDDNPEDASRELQEDLMSIVTVFVAKKTTENAQQKIGEEEEKNDSQGKRPKTTKQSSSRKSNSISSVSNE